MVAAPGSQNGFDNSGHRGPIDWDKVHEHINITLDAIQALSERYAPHADVVTSIEALRSPAGMTPESTTKVHAGKYDSQNGESLYDLAIASQYSQGTGSPQLLKFLSEHINVS